MLELINRLGVYADVKDACANILDGHGVVSFLNAHAVNLAYSNSEFRHCLIESDYLLRDGSGINIACNMLGIDSGPNLNGSDLIPELLSLAASKSYDFVFIGGTKESADLVRLKVDSFGVNRVLVEDGYRSDNYYFGLLKDYHKEKTLVILGMGMPKQEIFSLKLSRYFEHQDIIIVNGGAIIDRMAGLVSRGPLFLKKVGLEWLYRLAVSPRRLFGRYVIGIPIFFLHLISAKLQK